MVGLEHLQLQRHRQAILDPAFAQPHQHLAALDEAADDQRLQAGEVGEPVGVGAAGELRPEPVRLRGQLRRRRPRPRQQPGADHVADQRGHRLGGVGVVADEVARAVAEPGDRRGDLGVGAGAGGDPPLGATTELRALVGASENRHRLPLAGTPQPRARRHRADRTVEPVHGVYPLLKAAKLRRGFGRPAALAIAGLDGADAGEEVGGRAVLDALAVVAHPQHAARIGTPQLSELSFCPAHCEPQKGPVRRIRLRTC